MKKFILFFFLPFIFYAQEISFDKYYNWLNPDEMSMKTTQVKDNIYMIEGIGGGFGNVGVFVGENGIIMIDDSFEILEELLNEAIAKISNKPIKYIINTHYHFDHADGNRYYGKKGIPIVSHHNVRTRQAEITTAYGGIFDLLENFNVPAHEMDELPTVTYENTMNLHEGNETISMHYFGQGHTDGDSIIKFNKANVVHTGDSFILYGLPFIDITNGGSIKGFIKTLANIAEICDEDTIIIPGHGGLTNVEGVKKMRDDLQLYYDTTISGHKKGLTIEQISSSINIDLGKTNGFGDPLTVKHNFIRSILLENNIIK